MDLNVLLEDLKNAAENLQKNPSNIKPLSTAYCHKVTKVVDKVSHWNTEYDNVITGLWVITAHFTETLSGLLQVPSFKEAATRLFRECAKAVLNIQWQNLEEDSDVRQRFVVSLANLNAKLIPLNYQRFRLLESLLENPWTNPTLAKIMGGEAEDDEEKEEVQNYIAGEDAIILQLRVDMMLKENCEEYALNLCNSCLLHPELKRDLTLRKTQLSLLHKLGLRDKLQEECQNLSVQEAVNVIRQLQTRNTKEICTVLAQNFMVQHWIRQKDHKANKDLLRLWIRQQALADKDQDRFKESVWAIAKLSQSTDQILFFIDILREQCGKVYLQLYVDMCIFAINVDKGQMETNLKKGCTEMVNARKEDMSAICGKLACLNHHSSIKVARICVLTAFVLKPCIETFQSIIKFYSQNYNCCGTCTKTSNSTDHGTVNPATLYEVERLLNMLRPEYLNPDNSLSNIKTLCERFCKENNLNIPLNTTLPKPQNDNAQLRMVQIEAFGKPNAASAKSSNVFEAVTPNVNNSQTLLRNKTQDMQNLSNRPPSSSSQLIVSSAPHAHPNILHARPRHPSPVASLQLRGSASSLDPYKSRQPSLKTNTPQQVFNHSNRFSYSGPRNQIPSTQAKNPTKLNPQLIQYIQSAIRQNSSVVQELIKHPDKEIVRTVMNMLNQAGKSISGSANAKPPLQQQQGPGAPYLGDSSRLPTVSTLFKAPSTDSPQGQQSVLQQSSSRLQSPLSPSISLHQPVKTYSRQVNNQSEQNPHSTSSTNSYLQKADSFRKAKIQAGNIRSAVQSSLLQKQQVLSKQMAGSRVTVNPVPSLPVVRPAHSSTPSRSIQPHLAHSTAQSSLQTNITSNSTFNHQRAPQRYQTNVQLQQQQHQQSSAQSNSLTQPPALSSDELSGSIMGIDDKIISELLQDGGIFSNTFPDIEVGFSLDDLDKKKDGRKASSDLQQPNNSEFKVGWSSLPSNSGSSFSSNNISQNQLSEFGPKNSSPLANLSKGYKSSPVHPFTLKPNVIRYNNSHVNIQSLTDMKPTINSPLLSIKGGITQAQPQMSVEQIREMMKQEEIDGEVTMDSSNNATYRCLICSVAFKELEELREHVRNVCKPGLQSSSVYNTKIKQDRANSAKAGLETTTVFQCLRCFELCISQEGIKQHRLTCKRVPTVPPDIKNATLNNKNNKTPPSRSTTPKMSSSHCQTPVTETKAKVTDNSFGKIIEKPSPLPLNTKAVPTSAHALSSCNKLNETNFTNNCHTVSTPPKQTSAPVMVHTTETNLSFNAITKKEEKVTQKEEKVIKEDEKVAKEEEKVRKEDKTVNQEEEKLKVNQEEEKVISVKPNKGVPPLTPLNYSEISGSGGCKFYRCKNCSQTLCSYESLVSHWKDCATKPPVFPYRNQQFPFDQDDELEPGEIRPLVGKVLQNVLDTIGAVARGEIGQMPEVNSDDEDLDFLLSQGSLRVAQETCKNKQGKITKKEYPSQSYMRSDDKSNSSGQGANKKFSCLTMRKGFVGKGVLKEKNEEINTQRAASAVAASRINESLKSLNEDESIDSDQDGSHSDDTVDMAREAPPTLRDRTKLKPVQSYINESFVSPFAKTNVHKNSALPTPSDRSKSHEAPRDEMESVSELSAEVKEEFKCIVCCKTCNSYRILVQHYASKHLQPFTMKTLSDGSSYFCHLCQKSFSTFVHYMHHVPIHATIIMKKMAIQYSCVKQKRKHRSKRIAASRGFTIMSSMKKGGMSPKRAKALLSKKKAAKSVRDRMKRDLTKTSINSSLPLNGEIKPKIFKRRRKFDQRIRSKSPQQSLQEKLLKRKIESKGLAPSKAIRLSENEDSCASSSPYMSDFSDDDEYYASEEAESDSTVNEPPQTRNRLRVTRSADIKNNDRGKIKISPTSLALVPELSKMLNIHPCVSVHRLTQSEVEKFTKSKENELNANMDVISDDAKENSSKLSQGNTQDQKELPISEEGTQKRTDDVAWSSESKKPLHPMVSFQSSFETYIQAIKSSTNSENIKREEHSDCQEPSSNEHNEEHEMKNQSKSMVQTSPEVKVAISISDNFNKKEIKSKDLSLKEKEILSSVKSRRCSVNLGQKIDVEQVKLSDVKSHDLENEEIKVCDVLKSPSSTSSKTDDNQYVETSNSKDTKSLLLPTCAVVLERKAVVEKSVSLPVKNSKNGSGDASAPVATDASKIFNEETTTCIKFRQETNLLPSFSCSPECNNYEATENRDQELKSKVNIDINSANVKSSTDCVVSEDLVKDCITSNVLNEVVMSEENMCSNDIVEFKRQGENCMCDSELKTHPKGKSEGVSRVPGPDAGMGTGDRSIDEERDREYFKTKTDGLLPEEVNKTGRALCSEVVDVKECDSKCVEEANKQDTSSLKTNKEEDAFPNEAEVNKPCGDDYSKNEIINQGQCCQFDMISDDAVGVEYIKTQGDVSAIKPKKNQEDCDDDEERNEIGESVNKGTVNPFAQQENNDVSKNIDKDDIKIGADTTDNTTNGLTISEKSVEEPFSHNEQSSDGLSSLIQQNTDKEDHMKGADFQMGAQQGGEDCDLQEKALDEDRNSRDNEDLRSEGDTDRLCHEEDNDQNEFDVNEVSISSKHRNLLTNEKDAEIKKISLVDDFEHRQQTGSRVADHQDEDFKKKKNVSDFIEHKKVAVDASPKEVEVMSDSGVRIDEVDMENVQYKSKEKEKDLIDNAESRTKKIISEENGQTDEIIKNEIDNVTKKSKDDEKSIDDVFNKLKNDDEKAFGVTDRIGEDEIDRIVMEYEVVKEATGVTDIIVEGENGDVSNDLKDNEKVLSVIDEIVGCETRDPVKVCESDEKAMTDRSDDVEESEGDERVISKKLKYGKEAICVIDTIEEDEKDNLARMSKYEVTAIDKIEEEKLVNVTEMLEDEVTSIDVSDKTEKEKMENVTKMPKDELTAVDVTDKIEEERMESVTKMLKDEVTSIDVSDKTEKEKMENVTKMPKDELTAVDVTDKIEEERMESVTKMPKDEVTAIDVTDNIEEEEMENVTKMPNDEVTAIDVTDNIEEEEMENVTKMPKDEVTAIDVTDNIEEEEMENVTKMPKDEVTPIDATYKFEDDDIHNYEKTISVTDRIEEDKRIDVSKQSSSGKKTLLDKIEYREKILSSDEIVASKEEEELKSQNDPVIDRVDEDGLKDVNEESKEKKYLSGSIQSRGNTLSDEVEKNEEVHVSEDNFVIDKAVKDVTKANITVSVSADGVGIKKEENQISGDFLFSQSDTLDNQNLPISNFSETKVNESLLATDDSKGRTLSDDVGSDIVLSDVASEKRQDGIFSMGVDINKDSRLTPDESISEDVELANAGVNNVDKVNKLKEICPVSLLDGEAPSFSADIEISCEYKSEISLSSHKGMEEVKPFANTTENVDGNQSNDYGDSNMNNISSDCIQKQLKYRAEDVGQSKMDEIYPESFAETRDRGIKFGAVNINREDKIVVEEGDRMHGEKCVGAEIYTHSSEGVVCSMKKDNEELNDVGGLDDQKEETLSTHIVDEPVPSNAVGQADFSIDHVKDDDHYESDVDILDLGLPSDIDLSIVKGKSLEERDHTSDEEEIIEITRDHPIVNDTITVDQGLGSFVKPDALELNGIKVLNEETASCCSDLRLKQIDDVDISPIEEDCVDDLKSLNETSPTVETEKNQSCQSDCENENEEETVAIDANDKDPDESIRVKIIQHSSDACHMVGDNEGSDNCDEIHKLTESTTVGDCNFVGLAKENSQRDNVGDADNLEKLNIMNEHLMTDKVSDKLSDVVGGLNQKEDVTNADQSSSNGVDSFMNMHNKRLGRNSPKQLRTRSRVYYGFNSVLKFPESNLIDDKNGNQVKDNVKQVMKDKKEIRRSQRKSSKKIALGNPDKNDKKKGRHCDSLRNVEIFVKTDIFTSEKNESSGQSYVDGIKLNERDEVCHMEENVALNSDKFELEVTKGNRENNCQDSNSVNYRQDSLDIDDNELDADLKSQEKKSSEFFLESSNIEGAYEESQEVQTNFTESHSQAIGAENKDNKTDINEDSVTEKELKARQDIRDMVSAKRKSSSVNKLLRRNTMDVFCESDGVEHDIDNKIVEQHSIVEIAGTGKVEAQIENSAAVNEEDEKCNSESVVKEKGSRSSCDEDDLSNYSLFIEEDKTSVKSYPDPFESHRKKRSRKRSSSSTSTEVITEVTSRNKKAKKLFFEDRWLNEHKSEATNDSGIPSKIRSAIGNVCKDSKEKVASKKMTWLERKREAFMEKKREESVPFTWDLEENPGSKGLENNETVASPSNSTPLILESRSRIECDINTNLSDQQNDKTSTSDLIETLNLQNADPKKKETNLKPSSSQEHPIATPSSKRVSRKRLSSPTSQTLVKVRKKLKTISKPLEDLKTPPLTIESPLTSTPKKRGRRSKKSPCDVSPEKNESVSQEKLKDSPHFINIDDDEISFNTRSLSPSFTSENTPEAQSSVRKRRRPKRKVPTNLDDGPQPSLKVKQSVVPDPNSSPLNVSDPKLKKAGLIPVAKACTPPSIYSSPNTRKDITSSFPNAAFKNDPSEKASNDHKHAEKDKPSLVASKSSQKMKYPKHSNVFEKFAIKSGSSASPSKNKITSPLLSQTKDSSILSSQETPIHKSDQKKKDGISNSDPSKGVSTAAVVKRRNPTTLRKHFDFQNSFKRKQTQPAKTTIYRVDPLPKSSATASITPEQFEKDRTLHTPLPPGVVHVALPKAVSTDLKWKIDKEMKPTKAKSKQRRAPVSFKRT